MRWPARAAAATVGTLLVARAARLRAGGGCRLRRPAALPGLAPFVVAPLGVVDTGGLGALAWVALKVGALSFGGGFVIIPLMQADAVHHYHWMTNSQFLNGVALGQITPGPVVQTVSVVGYAAAGVGGALLAALIAFAPSFVFILAGARHFAALRTNRLAQAFLGGAGPAAIGAIAVRPSRSPSPSRTSGRSRSSPARWSPSSRCVAAWCSRWSPRASSARLGAAVGLPIGG